MKRLGNRTLRPEQVCTVGCGVVWLESGEFEEVQGTDDEVQCRGQLREQEWAWMECLKMRVKLESESSVQVGRLESVQSDCIMTVSYIQVRIEL